MQFHCVAVVLARGMRDGFLWIMTVVTNIKWKYIIEILENSLNTDFWVLLLLKCLPRLDIHWIEAKIQSILLGSFVSLFSIFPDSRWSPYWITTQNTEKLTACFSLEEHGWIRLQISRKPPICNCLHRARGSPTPPDFGLNRRCEHARLRLSTVFRWQGAAPAGLIFDLREWKLHQMGFNLAKKSPWTLIKARS